MTTHRRMRHSHYAIESAGSVAELLQAAGPDFAFEVETRPALYRTDERQSDGAGAPDVAKAPAQVVVRRDTGEALAVVGPRYVPAQVRSFLAPLDPYIRDGSLRPVAAYSFDRGLTQVVELELQGAIELPGMDGLVDKLRRRLLWKNSHDGSGALSLADELVRLICTNGLTENLGLSHATFRHTRLAIGEALDLGEAFARSQDRFATFERKAHALLETPFSRPQMDEVAERIWPAGEEGEVSDAAEKARAHLAHLFTHGVGNSGVNAWDAVNAVTEYTTHHRPVRSGVTLSRLKSLWFGDGLAKRASDAVLEVAGIVL